MRTEGTLRFLPKRYVKRNIWQCSRTGETRDIFRKTEQRRLCKIRKEEAKYKKLQQDLKRMCREATQRCFEDKCKETESVRYSIQPITISENEESPIDRK